MLNFRDALTLTKSKMKARKGRTIGTAITMSLGLVVLMSASFAAKGVENTAFDLLEAPTNDRWFASVSLVEEGDDAEDISGFGPSSSLFSQGQADRIASDMKARDRVKEAFVRTSFVSQNAFGLTTRLADTPEETSAYSTFDTPDDDRSMLVFQPFTLSTIDPQFMEPYVRDGYTLTERRDGRIPVLIPSSAALMLGGYEEPRNPSDRRSREEFEKKNQLLQEVIGSPVTLQRELREERMVELAGALADRSYEIETTSIELVVVGLLPGDGLFGGTAEFGTSDFLIAESFHEELAAQLEEERVAASVVAEYVSEEALEEDFVGEDPSFFSFDVEEIALSQERVSVFPIGDSKSFFDEILSFARKAGYWIGGFLLVISALLVWMSLARVVRDSRREIGVFRAVGARKRDIVKIVALYALSIGCIAFVISSVLSVALTLGVSAGWGDRFFFELASLGSISTVNPPAFAFFGITPMIVLVSVGATLLAAFVGAFFPARKAAKLDPVVALRDV